MNESEEKQDVQYSLTKITEETNTPRERGAFNHRWSDFGNNDPLAEFMRDFKPKTEAPTKAESTKEKSEKEKKQEEINRLYNQFSEKDREFEKAKGKRAIITTLAFSVFYFVIGIVRAGEIAGIVEVFGEVLAAIFLAVIHVLANSVIFGQLTEMGRREEKILEDIKKQIREAENSHN